MKSLFGILWIVLVLVSVIGFSQNETHEKILGSGNRPIQIANGIMEENKEAIRFRNYKKNPIEFLVRVEEYLKRHHHTNWNVIRSILDELFKDVYDHWWTATRPELTSYREFETAFKAKYWSESTQNIVRDNLSNGRYEANKGITPTAYFLSKVCIARNLEPRISEECLVTKLAYHYEEGITRARFCGEIKIIQGMAALLENYEHERYYQQNRRTPNYRPTNQNSNHGERDRLDRDNGYNRNRREYRPGNGQNYNPGDQRGPNNMAGNRTEQLHNRPTNQDYNPNRDGRNHTERNRNSNSYQPYRPRINFIRKKRTHRPRTLSWSQGDQPGYFERQQPIRESRPRGRSQENRRERNDGEPTLTRVDRQQHYEEPQQPSTSTAPEYLNGQRQ